MGLFRRRERETLNEQLLHEAGLDAPQPTASPEQPAPFDPFDGTYPAQPDASPWDVKSRAMARPAVDDVVTTAHATGIAGDVVEFATLRNGDVIVDEEQGDGDLAALAEAVEQHIPPPYRARGRREGTDLWAVAAHRIVVLRFACDGGDEIELVSRGGERSMRIDRVASTRDIQELEKAGAGRGADYVVEATRLDEDYWEVKASAL
jgi:hypothetical protein